MLLVVRLVLCVLIMPKWWLRLSLFCTESEGGAGGLRACVISRLVRYSVALQRLLALPASSALLCMPCSCKNANRAWLAHVVSYLFWLAYLAHVPQDFSFWFLWHFNTTDATVSTCILFSLYAVILIFFLALTMQDNTGILKKVILHILSLILSTGF